VRSYALALALFVLATPASAQELVVADDPAEARLVTEDIGRFWAACDQSEESDLESTLRTMYLDAGTVGLEDFVDARIGSAADLAAVVKARPGYYASIRESTRRVPEFAPAIRASFFAMEYLYPEARFPDVYFLIGRMSSGGTTSRRGLLIGTEMYGLTDQAPLGELNDWLRTVLKPIDAIPHIVAHELVHYQQADLEGEPDLLDKCVREGMADFVAELISGRHINEHVHEWALPREHELWVEFQGRMHGSDHTGWLYGGQPEGRPADLGYFIGYRICQAIYDRSEDPRAALRQMLETADGTALLEASGYDP
jgi:hypothetical protein